MTATDLFETTRSQARKSRKLSRYGQFSVVLLLISVATLIPSFIIPLVSTPQTLSTHVVFHGCAFLGWYALMVLQSGLVSRGHTAVHRKLGYGSIVFATVLSVSGAVMLVSTMNSFRPDWTADYFQSRTSFVWAILHTLMFFSGSFILAIAFRKHRETHKRLMIMASLSMIAPSMTRLAYLPFVPIDGTAFTLLSTYLFLAVPYVIDRCTLESVHPVIKYGIPVYALTQILALGVMPTTDFGRDFAFFR